ncbi:MAG: DUF2007 domain-containing protein [Clostridia bacterium]|nr:DUF2007 domain-containing protein [Clostridia bacterium]
MKILKKLFSKRVVSKPKEPALVASVSNTVLSEVYQDLLRENNIPFICRRDGVNGYLKVITGGFLVTDDIYVKEEDYTKARELYDNYINGDENMEFTDSEE